MATECAGEQDRQDLEEELHMQLHLRQARVEPLSRLQAVEELASPHSPAHPASARLSSAP